MSSEELIGTGEKLLENGTELMLVRILVSTGSTPRGNDAFMLVGKDGQFGGTVGGGAVEFRAAEDAKTFLSRRAGGQKTYNLSRNAAADIGMICGGDVKISFTFLCGEDGIDILDSLLKELRAKKPRAFLFGGGHVSVCLFEELLRIGFAVTVYDDREEFANRERFPGAENVVCAPYAEMGEQIKISAGDFAVVMTRGHVSDYEVQKFLLGTEAGYIGVIGSHAKVAEVSRKLLEDGIPAGKIGACYAPIGLQIGAETPEEIAVSIAAEMILVRARMENRRKVREHKVMDYHGGGES